MSEYTDADKVIQLVHAYAHRRRHLIPHTGHTVNRLLAAVSELIGHRVVIKDGNESQEKVRSGNGAGKALALRVNETLSQEAPR